MSTLINHPNFQSLHPQHLPEEGFYLFLNCVNHRAEQILAFGPFVTPDEARAYHNQELLPEMEVVGSGSDQRYLAFRAGPLRMMNSLSNEELNLGNGPFGHGIVRGQKEVRIALFVDGCYPQKESG